MLIDICGQTFGQLKVVCLSDEVSNGGERKWVCECSCGRTVHIRGWELRSGKRTCCSYCTSKKPRRPQHEPKTDCRAYAGDRCAGLLEMFCRTRGECKFYKSKDTNRQDSP